MVSYSLSSRSYVSWGTLCAHSGSFNLIVILSLKVIVFLNKLYHNLFNEIFIDSWWKFFGVFIKPVFCSLQAELMCNVAVQAFNIEKD